MILEILIELLSVVWMISKPFLVLFAVIAIVDFIKKPIKRGAIMIRDYLYAHTEYAEPFIEVFLGMSSAKKTDSDPEGGDQ